MSAVAAPRELVLASAGSGKTYLLASRYIGLVAAGEKPERVLASTFTRKAAGQILDRVLARLARASLDAGAAAELARAASLGPGHVLPESCGFWASVLETVVRDLHRTSIGTLDAFFMRAASAFAPELGLPPLWRIPDEPAAARLRSRALLDLLATADRPRLIELLRLAGRGDARSSVHGHLASMMDALLGMEDQLDPTAADPWSAFGRAGKAMAPSTAEAREAIAAALEAIELPRTKSGGERKNWGTNVRGAAAAVRAGDWEALLALTLCRRVALGEALFDGVEIDDDVAAAFADALAAARAALRPRLAAQVEALGELTRAYRACYRDLQRRSGLYGFPDVIRLIAAGDPLGDRADLYYRLDAQTRHVLLDEFQDTALPQWEALAPIVDEILSDDGRAAILVADPKQSIYGWRGAEPAVVHAVGRRYGLDARRLDRSWRSGPVVLDVVNRVFTGLADNPVFEKRPECADTVAAWAEDFSPHASNVETLPGYVEIEVGPADEGRGSQRPLLCRRAAERVAELRSEAPGFSIGVLVRTNAAVARLYLELRELGLPVSQEGGNPLTDTGACEAILALFHLADHPGDTAARYLVAASPLGAVVGYRDHADGSGALDLSLSLRRELAADGYGRVVTRLAQAIVQGCDAREARRLSQLAELAHRYDADAGLRPSDFVRLAASERVEDRATAEIRVMTVHQAKGLEFDIVVLPELDATMIRGRFTPAYPHRPDPTGRITAILPAAGAELRCLFPELEAAYRPLGAAGLRDGLSTLYVALTRARYALHMLIAPDGASKPGRALTPAMLLRHALTAPGAELEPAVTGHTIYRSGDPAWFRDPAAVPEKAGGGAGPPPDFSVRLRAENRGRSLRRQSPSQLHGDASVDVRELLRIDTVDALDRGSLVHAWFEQVGWIEDALPDDDALLALAGTAPPLSEARARGILAEFRAWVADPAIRGALSRERHPGDAEVRREVPFLHRRDDVLVEGVIDRLVVRREGGRVVRAEILDYKTDRVDAQMVPAMVERYRAQLGAYADAVSEMYGLPREKCSAVLVFLEPRIVVELPATPSP